MLNVIKGLIELLKLPIILLIEISQFIVYSVKSLWRSFRWVAKESVKAGKFTVRGARGTIKFFKYLVSGNYSQAFALIAGAAVKIGIFIGVLAGLGLLFMFVSRFLSNVMP